MNTPVITSETSPVSSQGASQTPAQIAATPAAAMIKALGLISMISGLLVALAYEITAPIIAEGHRLATEKAVLQVFPGAVSKRDFILGPKGLIPRDNADQETGATGEPVYAAYDAQGHLKGVAITGTGNGYAGPVEVMFAYAPDHQAIVGSKVQKSNETPGFGDKLDKDPTFLKNFTALDARLNAEGTALANPIVTVKHGAKVEPWQIDAISGATISSRAMGKAANQAAQRAVPAIQHDLAILSQP